MGKRGGGIKFTPNDNPSLTSPEETNGAPRWCFNITNYLGVLGKGTDVALRMRKGWGAGQGHHTPRLGSDKHGWLRVLACPAAIERETWTETQELWIERYSAEGLRGGWGQGRGGSPLSYAWIIHLACTGLRGRALAKITNALMSKETDKNPLLIMELLIKLVATTGRYFKGPVL